MTPSVACAARAAGIKPALPPSSRRAATHGGASTRAPGVKPAPRARPRSRRRAVSDDRGTSPSAPPSSHSWHRLRARWEADEETAMEGELLDLLSPAWRIMLLSDGSVTRHLRLLCPNLNRIKLELVAQRPVGTFAGAGGAEAMPADVARIEGDLVQREVLLRIRGPRPERDDTQTDETDVTHSDDDDSDDSDDPNATVPAVYAASWWSADVFAEFMADASEPMWSNLREKNVELYREVRRVYQGENAELERVFRTKGPFWGRHYIFWHGGKPMTVVYEVFNPRLENALGPAKPPAR